MLRRSLLNRAAPAASSVDLPPSTLTSVLVQRRVLRLLGGTLAAAGGETAARLAKVYTDIADSKSKSSALPHGRQLAIAGRAAALLSCGCLDDAAADLQSIKATGDAGLARVAASLQVRVTSARLTHLVRTQDVQGSAAWIDPSGISTVAAQLNKDIALLASVSNKGDFTPILLSAEAALNGASGSPASACAAFESLNEAMFKPSAAAAIQGAQAKQEEAPSVTCVMAFDAQRAWATEKAFGVTPQFKHIAPGTGFSSDGAVVGKEKLTTEERAALLQIAAWREDAFSPINVLDMGDAAVAGYGPSASSAHMLLKVGHFLGLYSAHNAVVPNLESKLSGGGFDKPGSHSVEAIEAALKNTSEGVLDQLASFHCSRLGVADDAYAAINESLAHGYGGRVTDFSNIGTPAAEQALASLEEDLLNQAFQRAQVGLAAACASNNQLTKADQLLDEVISHGNYAELWRAYLLKGNVAKKLGQVDASDAAFRALHSLKIQPEGRDLPLRDQHRDISAF